MFEFLKGKKKNLKLQSEDYPDFSKINLDLKNKNLVKHANKKNTIKKNKKINLNKSKKKSSSNKLKVRTKKYPKKVVKRKAVKKKVVNKNIKKMNKKNIKKTDKKIISKRITKTRNKINDSKKISKSEKPKKLNNLKNNKKVINQNDKKKRLIKKIKEQRQRKIIEKKEKIRKRKEERLLRKKLKLKKGLKKITIKNILKNKGLKSSGLSIEKIKKMRLGVKGFDDLFREGIPEGASILIEGGPGSGKTIFCLQICNNACLKGKKVLYMTFEEPVRRLKTHMESFGWNPQALEKKGLLQIRKFNSLDVARSVEALLSEAKRELLIDIQPILIPEDFKPDIVCIDSLSSIASAFSGEEHRFRIYMEQLFKYLESHDITSFLIRETSNPSHVGSVYSEGGEAVSFLSDGIVIIYNVIFDNGKRGRALEVLKMRGEDIDRRIVTTSIINKKGFVVYPDNSLNAKKGNYKLT